MPTSKKLAIAALLTAALVAGIFLYNRARTAPAAQEFQDSADEIDRLLPKD